MLTLIRNADVYAPAHVGMGDVLLEGERIAMMAPHLDIPENFPDLQVLDAGGRYLTPGYIDLHVHVTGGGGEDGFSSRSPESRLTDFTRVGVTTVVGLLGTDGIARNLEALFAKVSGLEEEGLTTFMLTGSYGVPTATLTGSVERDMVLIHKVVGAKVAISDHRSSEPTFEELMKLATQVRRGGMLAKKAGILTIHMGDGRVNLDQLFRAADETEVPLSTFLPTHVDRNEELFREAVRWVKRGGQADFTAGVTTPGGTADFLCRALDMGADMGRMTLSSDAFGSQPKFDDKGSCIGLGYGTSAVLHREVQNMVQGQGLPLDTALAFVTENPARVLKQEGRKGVIAPGADADLLLMGEDLTIDTVFARGRKMLDNGEPIVKGRFE